MAGKHVGGADYQADGSHICPSPYRKENRAYADGAGGLAAPGDVVGNLAHTAGAANGGEETDGASAGPQVIIPSSADYGRNFAGIAWTAGNYAFHGHSASSGGSGDFSAGAIFRNVNVNGPASSVVLTIAGVGAETGAANLRVAFEDAANPVDFDNANLPLSKTLTTAGANVLFAGLWTTGVDLTTSYNEWQASYGDGTKKLIVCINDQTGTGENFISFAGAITHTLTITP